MKQPRSFQPTLALASLVSAALVVMAALAFTATPALADTAPSLTIDPATTVSYTTVHVSGAVNPEGAVGAPEVTAWSFEYSKNPSEEGWTPDGSGVIMGAEAEASTPVAVQGDLAGLSPNTAYQVRLIATNEGGEVTSGNPNPSFTTKEVTPPTATIAPVTTFTARTAHFSGTINPNAPGASGQDPAFNTAWHFQCTPECPGLTGGEVPADDTAHEVTAEATGLQPNTLYKVTLVATNQGGQATAGPETLTTSGEAPAIDSETVSDVKGETATLGAKINAFGSPTTYHFEYVTDAEFQSSGYTNATRAPAPDAQLGEAHADAAVTLGLSNLAVETTYHARVVATNTFGETPGPDQTFKTVQTEAALPDGRVYELVTPPDNQGADVYIPEAGLNASGVAPTPAEMTFQAAAGGEAVTYVADPTSPGGNGAASGGELGNQYLSVRSSTGWSQEDISPPGHFRIKYDAFSDDLGTGILGPTRFGREPSESSALPGTEAPGEGYRVLYSRDDTSGVERSLFTSIPSTVEPFEFQVRFAGGSADFGTLFFDATAALTPDAPTGNDVYESREGRLRPINFLPGGAPEPNAVVGAPNVREAGDPEVSHAVSADGSRVIWSGLSSRGLYSTEGTTTTQIDVSQAGGPGGGGTFWTASTDGSQIFFTDDASAGLTADTVPGSGVNLYRYDIAAEAGHHLTDLTAAADARVQGVIGASNDGSYVYFVADGALAEGAGTGECQREWTEETKHNECDLYVWHGGAAKLIAALSEEDGVGLPPLVLAARAGVGDWVQGLATRAAVVAGSGKGLTFISTLDLTGYQNDGATEVYVYDADSGSLSCASCDPSGQPVQLNSRVPQVAGVPVESWTETRQVRSITDDGSRVFFDSLVPLVPQDTDGTVDVYEWERDGSDTCMTSGGCIYLLSGGKSADDSYLLDASASGNDVFIATRARLTEADQNEDFDVYDVRVDGVRPASALSCSGTGCQGVPPAPPVFATPSSGTFNGVGNFPSPATAVIKPSPRVLTNAQKLAAALKACHKKPKSKRANCEKQARKRYVVKSKAKKPSNHRRAK